jgi:holo-[acyl-carrier protein] synthase
MVGVDVVDMERLRTALERSPGLEERLFTKRERAYCRAATDPIVRFAGTLAAKEAAIKALRLGPLVAWASRIEIQRDASRAPVAVVRNDGRARAIQVSISHDGPVAVAVALDLS